MMLIALILFCAVMVIMIAIPVVAVLSAIEDAATDALLDWDWFARLALRHRLAAIERLIASNGRLQLAHAKEQNRLQRIRERKRERNELLPPYSPVAYAAPYDLREACFALARNEGDRQRICEGLGLDYRPLAPLGPRKLRRYETNRPAPGASPP